MLRELNEKDTPTLREYLLAEPEYNLFTLGDLENHGFGKEYLQYFAHEPGGRMDAILMRYWSAYILYSRDPAFQTEPFTEMLTDIRPLLISGKTQAIARIWENLHGYKRRDTHLSRLRRIALETGETDFSVATEEDAEDIVALYCDTEEFNTRQRRAESTLMIKKDIQNRCGRYYLVRRNGELISSAAATAEYSKSAMIIGVVTRKQDRGQGLATKLVVRLCRDLLASGKDSVCLFYDNPQAGAIYRRIGFEPIGTWTMLENAYPEGVQTEAK